MGQGRIPLLTPGAAGPLGRRGQEQLFFRVTLGPPYWSTEVSIPLQFLPVTLGPGPQSPSTRGPASGLFSTMNSTGTTQILVSAHLPSYHVAAAAIKIFILEAASYLVPVICSVTSQFSNVQTTRFVLNLPMTPQIEAQVPCYNKEPSDLSPHFFPSPYLASPCTPTLSLRHAMAPSSRLHTRTLPTPYRTLTHPCSMAATSTTVKALCRLCHNLASSKLTCFLSK